MKLRDCSARGYALVMLDSSFMVNDDLIMHASHPFPISGTLVGLSAYEDGFAPELRVTLSAGPFLFLLPATYR